MYAKNSENRRQSRKKRSCVNQLTQLPIVHILTLGRHHAPGTHRTRAAGRQSLSLLPESPLEQNAPHPRRGAAECAARGFYEIFSSSAPGLTQLM